MSKILKNTTLVDIDLDSIGIRILAESSATINVEDYILLASGDSITELTPLINSGDIVINDGTNDLSITDGIAFIKYPDKSYNIRFDNSSNEFISDDVQSAIEENANNMDKNLFKYVLTEDLLIKNNYSLVTTRIIIGDNKLTLGNNSILEIV